MQYAKCSSHIPAPCTRQPAANGCSKQGMTSIPAAEDNLAIRTPSPQPGTSFLPASCGPQCAPSHCCSLTSQVSGEGAEARVRPACLAATSGGSCCIISGPAGIKHPTKSAFLRSTKQYLQPVLAHINLAAAQAMLMKSAFICTSH